MFDIPVKRHGECAMSHQIYEYIRNEIMTGKLCPDQKLPSSRFLASYLNVARNSVIEAYEQLIAEGYAYTIKGAGTFTSQGVMYERLNQDKMRQIKSEKRKEDMIHEQQNLADIENCEYKIENNISFRTGVPDLGEIPIKKWAQTYHSLALDLEPKKLDYQDSCGSIELRKAISKYLNRVRGVNTSPENILITSGAAQSFHLLCQFVGREDYVLVENPMSEGVCHTLEANHILQVPVSVDKDGMITSTIKEIVETQKQNQHCNTGPRLIFTTPSHQFPTGAMLPAARRIELVKLAYQLDAYIIEDDYDSEFRFDGAPIQAMQYLAPERVIYVGTFSKTLMPAIRIGYMVLPHQLLRAMKEAKYIDDIHSPILEQLTLARFLENGSYENHIRKMRKIYRRKRDMLVKCLNETYGDKVKISGAQAGIHLMATFFDVNTDDAVFRKIQTEGIEIKSVKYKQQMNENRHVRKELSFIFGYGNTPIDYMQSGVERLKAILYSKFYN